MLSRALQQSVKIALQIEHTGYLCLQIMMPITKDLGTGVHMGILEFKVSHRAQFVLSSTGVELMA
jgi:cell cycle checkpoint protein